MFRGCIKLNYSAVLKAHQLYLLQPAYTGVIRETQQESSSQDVSDRWCQFWQSRWFGVHTSREQTGCHLVQGVEAESHWCTWELLWSWRVNICTVDSVATYISALWTVLQHSSYGCTCTYPMSSSSLCYHSSGSESQRSKFCTRTVGQSVWHPYWTDGYWDRFLLQKFCVILLVSFHQCSVHIAYQMLVQYITIPMY